MKGSERRKTLSAIKGASLYYLLFIPVLPEWAQSLSVFLQAAFFTMPRKAAITLKSQAHRPTPANTRKPCALDMGFMPIKAKTTVLTIGAMDSATAAIAKQDTCTDIYNRYHHEAFVQKLVRQNIISERLRAYFIYHKKRNKRRRFPKPEKRAFRKTPGKKIGR